VTKKSRHDIDEYYYTISDGALRYGAKFMDLEIRDADYGQRYSDNVYPKQPDWFGNNLDAASFFTEGL
jgi:hypothetical protein